MIARPPQLSLRAELPQLESTLLWCMRAWVIGHCQRTDVSERIAQVLAHVGAPHAPAYLDGFMWALSQGARRTIEIDCVCHPEVSADEHMLLEVFALQQYKDHDRAYAILAHLMTRMAATAASDSAQRLTLSLYAAGQALRSPFSDPVRYVGQFAAAGSSRCLH